MVSQVLQAGNGTPTKEIDPASHPGGVPVVVEDSEEDNSNNDLMVSPFIIPVTLKNLHGLAEVHQGALIDSGYTRCLMRNR